MLEMPVVVLHNMFHCPSWPWSLKSWLRLIVSRGSVLGPDVVKHDFKQKGSE